MQFFGGLLLVLAVIFFFVARSQRHKAGKLSATDTYDAATLQTLHTKIVGTLGSDAFAQQCDVVGTVEADQPLTGPFSGQPVVNYSAAKTREYEERVTKRNAEGKSETTTERGSEQIEEHKEQIVFYVRDAGGRVRVDPKDAEIELVETHRSLNQPDRPSGGARRTTGIRSVERALPVGTQVFIHGCALDRGGEVVIGKHPHRRDEKYLISLRGKRELLQSASGTARNMQIAAAISGAIGLVLLVLGFLS
jgi:hypothetical protein